MGIDAHAVQVYDTSAWNQFRVLHRRETLLRRRSKLLFKAVVSPSGGRAVRGGPGPGDLRG